MQILIETFTRKTIVHLVYSTGIIHIHHECGSELVCYM